MIFLRSKITIALLLTAFAFGFASTAKAQTIAPASQLVGVSDVPASNLTASLLSDRDSLIKTLNLYCASQNCKTGCRASQRTKCNRERTACGAKSVVAGATCGGAGAVAGGPLGFVALGATCLLAHSFHCVNKLAACLADLNWLYSCINNCQQIDNSKSGNTTLLKRI